MSFLALIAVIVSIIAISKSNDALSKVIELKNQLGRLEGDKAKKDNYEISSLTTPLGQEHLNESQKDTTHLNIHTAQTSQQQRHNLPQEDSAFVKWLKEDWLLKLGGVLVLMGVLFFLSLAFTIIGPQGKVSIGYLFGIALMVFGFKYAKKQLIGGSAIHLIGAVVVIITTYVARLPDYNLFNSYVAMLLMFLTSACVALTSYAHNRSELAHVGLMMSALVPVLVSTGAPTFFEILLYLLVVILGTLWLALITKWRSLVFLALIIVCGYSLLAASGAFGTTTITPSELYLIAMFSILFYITSLFSIFRGAGVMEKYDALVALLNAGFALFWIVKEASPEAAPFIIAFLSLAYATGFFLVYKLTSVYTSFIVYGGTSLGLLTTAVMLQLTGRSETVALLIIGALATAFTYHLSKDEEVTGVVAFFNVIPLGLILVSLDRISQVVYRHQGLAEAWKDIFVLGLAITIYFALFKYFVTKVKKLAYVPFWVGIALTVIFVWQVLHLTIGGGFATFLSILVYTVVGLTTLFNGTQQKNETKITVSKYWLGLVAARVIFWDAWQVGSVVFGVLICIVIGILLLSSTFIIKKVSAENA